MAADHMLQNMSARMADNLRDEISDLGTIKESEGEEAQTEVVTAIRAAADNGTISLIFEEEE